MPARCRLVAMTFVLSMLLYVDRIAMSTAKVPITGQLALTDTQFGWVLSAFALGYALFQTPAGALADRLGPRKVLAGVVMAWSVFTGLTAVAWSFGTMLLCRFFFGAGEAGAYPTCARAFYNWLPVGERGLATRSTGEDVGPGRGDCRRSSASRSRPQGFLAACCFPGPRQRSCACRWRSSVPT